MKSIIKLSVALLFALFLNFLGVAQVTNSFSNQGNVGIGTTNPTAKLHVKGTAKIDSSLTVSDSLRVMKTLRIGANSMILQDHGEEGEIYTNEPGEDLYIQSNSVLNNNTVINGTNEGKVGIGTDSPQSKLHVIGDTRLNGALRIGGTATFTEPPLEVDPCAEFNLLVVKDNGEVGTLKTPSDTALCDSNYLYSNPFWMVGGNAVNNDGRWIGTTTDNHFSIKTSGDLRLRIKKTGEMQFGVTRPLHFAQAGGSGVYGEYIGFNCYLNTTVTPNKIIKAWSSTESGQPGCAAIITDYSGNLLIQTWDSGEIYDEEDANLNPQFKFRYDGTFEMNSDGDFQIKRTTGNKVIFKVNSAEEKVFARGLRLTASNFPDYVFNPDYDLPTIREVEQFINENCTLPGMPLACEVEEAGMDVAEINRILVEKVEELTLYVIQLNKRIEELER